MKRTVFSLVALAFAVPASATVDGEINLGLRTSHFPDENSAKFAEYRDQSNGLFGDATMTMVSDTYSLTGKIVNPTLDDQSFSLGGNYYGLLRGKLYYDELNHRLSDSGLSPAVGIGSNYLTIPDASTTGRVPSVAKWTPFTYNVESKVMGTQLTIDPQGPLYFTAVMERQRKEGIVPYGLFNTSNFELPMPIEYTTYLTTFESGFRSKETTVAINAGYSYFENGNDILVTDDSKIVSEYSTPADNYSYNLGGRLTQRLPNKNILALKTAYTRSLSDLDWSKYRFVASPNASGEFDGDIRKYLASALLSSQWTNAIDSRLMYSYHNRDNQSATIRTITGSVQTNHHYEYEKHELGGDVGFRLSKANKLSGGYTLSANERSREDAETTIDNTVFAELRNTAIDWLTTKIRLEYLNRSSDSDYDEDTLSGDGLIHKYFTPFDLASKNRYKSKLSLEITPIEEISFALNYAMIFDDFDASELGVQEERRHEIYLDGNFKLPARIIANTYAGYEYSASEFSSRRYNPGGAEITARTTADNYNWSSDTTYDFFAVGGSLSIPMMGKAELILHAEHQLVDGNIDFARAAAAGAPLPTVSEADDYYRSQAGVKGIYRLTEALQFTLGYLYEKSNLDEWKYINYTYNVAGDYLSGAGLDHDYSVHQVYLITTFRF